MQPSADVEGESGQRKGVSGGVTGLLSRICFWVGAVGLMLAMGTDALAVVGRHLRMPLLGSIEIVQASIVVAASAAMVGATVSKSHAAVHILTERAAPVLRDALERAANLLGAALAVALLAGSAWIVADLWDGAEQTELLRLPLKPLRLFWCGSAGLMAVIFLARVFKRSERSDAA